MFLFQRVVADSQVKTVKTVKCDSKDSQVKTASFNSESLIHARQCCTVACATCAEIVTTLEGREGEGEREREGERE